MAVFDSPASTYSDTTPHMRTITDAISLIDPSDIPMIDLLGGFDGASSKFRFVNTPGKVVEWLEDTLMPLTTALTTASITSTVTTITVADASMWQPGHIGLAESELFWVSAVNTATDVLTVTRGVAGSTAATHASTVALAIVSMARLEGADSDSIAMTDRTTNSNYTQIFHTEVKVTRTHAQLAQYGIADEFEYQLGKVLPSLGRVVEKTLHYNLALAAGSATTPRIMAGYQGFITTNKVSGATLAKSQFDSAVKLIYNNGGSGRLVAVVSPTNMGKIIGFYDSTAYLRVTRTETSVGMLTNQIVTPYGVVDLVMDRWALDTIIPIIDTQHAGMLTYYPFSWQDLAISGDYMKKEVVGEFTFCLRQEKAHALLTAVS